MQCLGYVTVRVPTDFRGKKIQVNLRQNSKTKMYKLELIYEFTNGRAHSVVPKFKEH